MQNSADVLQHTIPDLMTQAVVHLFEVVNVDHDAGERVVAPRSPRDLRGDDLSVWMDRSLHMQGRVASVEEPCRVAKRRENLRKEAPDERSTIRTDPSHGRRVGVEDRQLTADEQHAPADLANCRVAGDRKEAKQLSAVQAPDEGDGRKGERNRTRSNWRA